MPNLGINTLFLKSFDPLRSSLALAAASIGTIAATPAIAEQVPLSAVVGQPHIAQHAAPLGQGDAQFKQLFTQWVALDNGGKASTFSNPSISSASISNSFPRFPNHQTISIPSRTPLDNSHVSSGYGMRTHPVIGGRRRHNGIDLAAKSGTPIYATADGIVSRANRYGSYGNYIAIEHGGEIQTRYAHLSRIAVNANDMVKKGELIGYVGSTGRSTGPHLHYEVRISGKSVNPMPYMAADRAEIAYTMELGRGGRGGR